MTYQNIRRFDAEIGQCRVKFISDLPHGARSRAQIAPSVPGPIIGTGASKARHSRLDQTPVEREAQKTRLQHYGRGVRLILAGAVKVKSPPAYIYELARRSIAARVGRRLGGY
jgi:hypothetical protein